MSVRCFLSMIAVALLVCLAIIPVNAAPSTELSENGVHHVAKRTGERFYCYADWIECSLLRIVVRIIMYITSDNDTPWATDLTVPCHIEDESDGSTRWTGDLVLKAGTMTSTSADIELTGDTSTLYGLFLTDPFYGTAIHELLGKCGDGKRDPHMLTFDGRRYTFNGHCSYVLSQECIDNDPSFQITADFRGKNPNKPYDPPTVMVAFNITSNGKQIVRINEDDSILIKGQPLTTHSARIGDNEGFVSHKGGNITMYLSQPSVSLNWDRFIHAITIGLEDANWYNNVCGLLGNADGNPDNDFDKPNGDRASDPEEFGNSWEVKGSCP